MGSHWKDWPAEVLATLRRGAVIPAHPLALDANRRLDERRQRALTRYYLDAGAGGLAVGVHTTQFAIREVGLYRPVLELAMRTRGGMGADAAGDDRGPCRPHRAGGAAKRRSRATSATTPACLSLAAMKGASEDELIAHAEAVAREIPLVGFYLQPAVGGIVLPVSFWRRFAEIENVVAIKIAPFNRYRTLDVVRGVVEAGAADRVALYTGNDDHIVLDLLTPFTVSATAARSRRADQGRAARPLERLGARARSNCSSASSARSRRRSSGRSARARLAGHRLQRRDLRRRQRFPGCIAGFHEVLRRQGLLEGIWCLDPDERSGPGQAEEIDRVCAAYPHLADDAFVRANVARWLA